jgi:hypothetical protein
MEERQAMRDILAVIRSYAGGSDEERRGLYYDQHHVEAVTGTVTLPEKLPCGLRGGFMGKCAFERYLSRKKVR